ncbi:DNA polymerase Y family protein [Polyangium sorediatum]|uniref:DNA polymerase Y family protein n=1 Tax=Polyangium sorediatum TaxID=889274 RepID=A0ABT6P301_9BACT|nr:DNA polymerase Y family protein [Polyangium sorediatum]MDI1434981.1 DNA polymerase Y family protein [Polyangium sorediatum]
MGRRIVAVVLPQLGCELVRQRAIPTLGASDRLQRPSPQTPEESHEGGPLAVLFARGKPDGGGEAQDRATAALDLVDEVAWRYGIRPGQRVAEAQATLAELTIQSVSFAEVDTALGRVAEVCLSLGTTAAIRLAPPHPDEDKRRGPAGDAPFDTVFLDVTGAAHLVGGEEALLDELCERIHALGHKVLAAIADGPRIARALARFAASPVLANGSVNGQGLRSDKPSYAPEPPLLVRKAPHPTVVAKPGARVLGPLPLTALPLDPDTAAFFGRLGIFTVEALTKLPRSELTPRLGLRAAEVLDLAAGRDELPLVPYAPPRTIVEETSFEDPIATVEPILFVLRGMTSRFAARLGARGEACLSLVITIPLDRSIASLRDPAREPVLSLSIDLPSPLSDAGDLHRALRAKLERAELFAPAVGVHLEVSQIVEARRVQIDLSRDKAVRPDALPALLAELSAEIGQDRVGLLEATHAHKPEARSKLVPVRDLDQKRVPAQAGDLDAAEDRDVPLPTRLFATPVAIGRITKGAVVAIDNRLYAIESLRFVMRLDGVEWWTSSAASRDYGVAWLVPGATSAKGPAGSKAEGASRAAGLAWVFVDRTTGEGYLQGWCE